MIWHICFKADTLAPARRGDEDKSFTSAQISLIDVACCQGGRVERRAFALGDSLGSEIDRERNGGEESPVSCVRMVRGRCHCWGGDGADSGGKGHEPAVPDHEVTR